MKLGKPLNFIERLENLLYLIVLLVLALISFAVVGKVLQQLWVFFEKEDYISSVVRLLENILIILITVGLINTIRKTIQKNEFQPISYLVVGIIAIIRRILVLSVETNEFLHKNIILFRNSMIEFAVLAGLIFVLVMGIFYLKKSSYKP